MNPDAVAALIRAALPGAEVRVDHGGIGIEIERAP